MMSTFSSGRRCCYHKKFLFILIEQNSSFYDLKKAEKKKIKLCKWVAWTGFYEPSRRRNVSNLLLFVSFKVKFLWLWLKGVKKRLTHFGCSVLNSRLSRFFLRQLLAISSFTSATMRKLTSFTQRCLQLESRVALVQRQQLCGGRKVDHWVSDQGLFVFRLFITFFSHIFFLLSKSQTQACDWLTVCMCMKQP